MSTTTWALGIGSPAFDSSARIAADSSGNVYATGHFSGTIDFDPGPDVASLTSSGNNDVYVAKYDPDGALVWLRQVRGADNEYAYAVAVDPADDLYVTGSFAGSPDFNGDGTADYTSLGMEDIFLLKFDGESGNHLFCGVFTPVFSLSSRGY